MPPPVHTIRLFQYVIYGAVLANTLFLLPMSSEIWGGAGLSNPMLHPDTPMYHLLFLLMKPGLVDYYPVIIALQIGAVILWFIHRWRTGASIVVFFTTAILFNAAHLYVTGGHTLIKLFLFYFIFLNFDFKSATSNAIGHVMFWACKIQIALLYFFAALYKWNGDYWVNGEALYYVISIREFSHPVLQAALLPFPWLLKLGTWFGLLYQSLFPLLIWFHPIKRPLLVAGVFFHLFIAFGMGLPDFGIFMVLSYTMFIRNESAEKILLRSREILRIMPARVK